MDFFNCKEFLLTRKKIKDILAISIIFFGDLLSLILSIYLAYNIRNFLNNYLNIQQNLPLNFYFHTYWIFVLFILFIANAKLYTKRFPMWDEIGKIIKTIVIFMFSVFTILTLTKLNVKYSRIILVLTFFFLILINPMIRVILKNLLYRICLWRENVIIIGDGKVAISAANGFVKEKHFGYFIVGFLTAGNYKIGDLIKINGFKISVLEREEKYKEIIKEFNITRVVIALENSGEKVIDLISKIQKHVPRVIVIPGNKGVPTLNTELYHLFREQLFMLKINNNLLYFKNRFVKRMFDLLLSIILLPFVVVISLFIFIVVKLDSEGEVFYTQDRIGKNGKKFKFIKIRTMYKNNDKLLEDYLEKNPDKREEWEEFKKLKGFDPRVTKVGKFLRKTSLDELAQIFNVIKGDMSLVGPRPYLPRERENMEQYYDNIVMARPGITGLWQISGRNKLTFEERLNLDSWYISNWSLWLDVEILIKTIKVVLKREGAY